MYRSYHFPQHKQVEYKYVRHFATQNSLCLEVRPLKKNNKPTPPQNKKPTTYFAQDLDIYMKAVDKAKDICKHMIIPL